MSRAALLAGLRRVALRTVDEAEATEQPSSAAVSLSEIERLDSSDDQCVYGLKFARE
jgi:hypothetical protein